MRVLNLLKRSWAVALIMAVGSYGVSVPAMADIVPTSDLLAQERLEVTRDQVNGLLQRDEVASMLADRGVDVDVLQKRVGSLTEAELTTLSQQMDTMPAGEGALGTIALILLILLLTDIAGVTDIFPGV